MTPTLMIINIVFNTAEILSGIAIAVISYISGRPSTEFLILNGLFWLRCILDGSITAVEYYKKRESLSILEDDDEEDEIPDTVTQNTISTTPLTSNPASPDSEAALLKWKSSVDIFTILLFIIANYFTLTIYPYMDEMYYYTVHWIALGYIKILFPVFLCGSLLCCPFTMRRMMTLFDEKIVVVPHQLRRKIQRAKWTKNEDEAVHLYFHSEYHTGCSICLDEFEEGDSLYLPVCGHPFHVVCLDNWLNVNNICPLCQTVIVKVNTKKR